MTLAALEPLSVHRTLGGEDILVYDDDAFAEMAGFEPGSHGFKVAMQLGRPRLAVLKVLYRHGKIIDRSGFAMGHLADRVREFDILSFNVSQIVAAPVMQVCVERVTNGRRTMSVALSALPRTWLRAVEGALHEPDAEPVVEPVLEADSRLSEQHPLEHQAPTPLADVAPVEGQLAGAVAMSLLAQVIEVLTTNGADMLVAKNAKLTDELTQARQRLGEQTGYVDRLRRDLRQAQDQVIAANHERDGLRARALAAEANLAIATSPQAAKLLDSELHKEVDRLMRQRPGLTHEPA